MIPRVAAPAIVVVLSPWPCGFWRRRFQSTGPCAACLLALHLTSFVIRDHFDQYYASFELCRGRNPLKKLAEASH